MKIFRSVAAYLLCLTVVSCNTCTNAANVPFEGGADLDAGRTADQSRTDADDTRDGSIADLDDGADATDMPGTCEPETVADACARDARSCGSHAWTDNCFSDRSGDCGLCDPNTSVCSASGTCACNAGFEMGGAGCVDIDECSNGTAMCPASEICVNQPGTFVCSDCPAGEVREGDVCVDIDECATGADNCDPLVTCTNALPLFTCGPCPAGYTDQNGDGTFCIEVNECDLGTDNCDANATCTNTPGAFTCACDAGYSGNGVTCTRVLVQSVTRLFRDFAGSNSSRPIPAGIDLSKVVPFATASARTKDDYEDSLVDVWIDSGSRNCLFGRGSGSDSVNVAVELVEFADADVQSGAFTLPAGSATVTVPLAVAVDPTTTFVVFSHQVKVTSTRAPEVSLTAVLSANSLTFRRTDPAAANLEGHWFTVSAPNHVGVHHGELTIPANSSACVTNSIPATSLTESFVLHSTRLNAVPTSDPVVHHVQCDLTSATTVECCRGAVSTGSTPVVQYQVVSVSGATVARGRTLLSSLSDTMTLTPAVDLPWSTAHLSTLGTVGATAAKAPLDDAEECAGFTLVSLIDATTLGLERGRNPPQPTEPWWKVVTWPH